MATTEFPELNARLLKGIERLRESAPGTMAGIVAMFACPPGRPFAR